MLNNYIFKWKYLGFTTISHTVTNQKSIFVILTSYLYRRSDVFASIGAHDAYSNHSEEHNL